MFLCDFHTHSYFSFDGDVNATIDAICLSAIQKGITDLALTDHFEANAQPEGFSSEYDDDSAYLEFCEAREKFKGKLNLVYGIEIGQGYQYPDEVKKLTDKHKFEFVIASLHNLRNAPDFYYLNFEKMPNGYISYLFDRYISELYETIDFLDKADTVGHITYMHRYTAECGIDFDFRPYYEKLESFFKKIIARDIALELNVSTLYKGLGFTMPDREILTLYRSCGGKLITVGSDAHTPDNLGRGISEGFDILQSVGFDRVLTVQDGQKILRKIN